MKQKIIFLVSPSGAGKSTFTKEYLEKNPLTLTCNRDNLRKSIHPIQKNWYKRLDLYKLEALVTQAEYLIFSEALENKYDVLIDNTNLKSSVINKFIHKAETYDVDIFFKIFDTTKEECKRNVLCRDFNCTMVAYDGRDFQVKYYSNVVFPFGNKNSYHVETFEEVNYIDKQFEDFEKIKIWLETNFKEKII